MTNGIKWIKLTTDMFDNRKIKHLRRLPEGDSVVLIWVMLLTMAGRCNANGMIFLTENIPYTSKMLADELDFEENTVRMALEALAKLNMIVCDGDFFCIAGWEEYQNIDGLERIREQTKARVARHRESKKLTNDGNVTCNVTVTQCNALDIDKEKELEGRVRNNNIHTSTKHADYDVIVEKFNNICVSLPSVTILSDKRKKAMDRVFIKETVISVDAVDRLFQKVEESDFLTGRTGTWKTNFDWIMNPTNIAKVLDGNYDNRQSATARPATGYQKQTKAAELDDFYKMAAEWAKDGEQ